MYGLFSYKHSFTIIMLRREILSLAVVLYFLPDIFITRIIIIKCAC